MAMSAKPMEEPVKEAPNGDNHVHVLALEDPPPLATQAAEQPQKELQDSLEGAKPPAQSSHAILDTTSLNHKSDSEAETEILSGKEDSNPSLRQEIKLEDTDVIALKPKPLAAQTNQAEVDAPTRGKTPSLKRKRGSPSHHRTDTQDDHRSISLTSKIPSPVNTRRNSEVHSSHSDRSKSSPLLDDNVRRRGSILTTDHSRTDEAFNEHGDPHAVNGRGHRDSRGNAGIDDTAHRSSSSPSRKTHRAHSTQQGSSHPLITKKRKGAAAPLIDRRSRPAEDALDSDSSSVQSHVRPQLNVQTSNASESVMWRQSKNPKKNVDRTGQTRLARACAISVTEAEELLKERPEDINHPDHAGNTPLQIASLKGKADVVKLLLSHGCKTDCENLDHDTPLIDAVENGHLEVVQLLLKAGVDPGQRNAKGEMPIDLANSETEDFDEIKDALESGIHLQGTKRRESEDHTRQRGSAPRDLGTSSNADSRPSPVDSARSPPLDAGTKRRTARSQHTNDALLWVNPTPQRLREAAGKGQSDVVSYILNMNPRPDIEALIAAAQGGHDEILGLMLAIMSPDEDPAPVRSGDHIKPGYTTPMLAAIGRGNVKVLNLLLAQRGFDPTRRLYKNMTYYDIAKERQSPEWQEEYHILKGAYDNYKKHGRSNNLTSPQKARSKRVDSRKSSPEPSSSPHASRKVRKPKAEPGSADGLSMERKREASYQGIAARTLNESRKSSAAPSPNGSPDGLKKRKNLVPTKARSTSPAELMPAKPRRRLLSGNEMKLDQSLKRKESITSGGLHRTKSGESIASRDNVHRRSSDASTTAPPSFKADSDSVRLIKEDSGKKRMRTSMSPQIGREGHEVKKKKRIRVDSEGNTLHRDPGRPHRSGPAPPANMVSITSATSFPTVAPTAFMGSATASPLTTPSITRSPIGDFLPGDSDAASYRSVEAQEDIEMQGTAPTEADRKRQEEEERRVEELLRQERSRQEEDERQAEELLRRERSRQEEEKRQAEELLRQERSRQEVADQIALVERQKAQAERESQLIKEREEEERRIEIAREKEAEAQRQVQEEERREREELEVQAKKRKEEELQRKRAEHDKKRREEQEKKRREAEEAERVRRLKAQQDEERARRESLPIGLRRYGEMSPNDARSPEEIARWLPLRTVCTDALEPECEPQARGDRWLSNVQAAPLLANVDLELSQYTAWSRRPATAFQQDCIWRQLRNPMSQVNNGHFVTAIDSYNFERENKPKFLGLKVFWIKLSDFMDIVPRHPHLASTRLLPRDFVLQHVCRGLSHKDKKLLGEQSSSSPHISDTTRPDVISQSPGIKEEGPGSPLVNGNASTGNTTDSGGIGALVNGYT